MRKEATIEIRGIHRKTIVNYVRELGGETSSNDKVLTGPHWECVVSPQESFRLFQSDIPKVTVTFSASNKEVLKSILTEFRKKTFRIGG
ncbi:MAG: hypothetical protein LRY73_10720 [Bacillus sp. (in: Bacteria)]|nr:hypothetical protein [Bacillus sp. (in: firmicutes)]